MGEKWNIQASHTFLMLNFLSLLWTDVTLPSCWFIFSAWPALKSLNSFIILSCLKILTSWSAIFVSWFWMTFSSTEIMFAWNCTSWIKSCKQSIAKKGLQTDAHHTNKITPNQWMWQIQGLEQNGGQPLFGNSNFLLDIWKNTNKKHKTHCLRPPKSHSFLWYRLYAFFHSGIQEVHLEHSTILCI